MSAGLVSQHQQSAFATPVNGDAGDATVVLGNDNATVSSYDAHDADASIHVQSSTATVFNATPAGVIGRKWMTNNTGAVYLYYDTGSAWVEVNYQRTASTGAVVIVSTSTPQLTVEYDGSHTSTFSVSSGGALTINATSTVTITPATTITGALTQTGLATFNGGATIASGQTLTVTGATITGLTAASVATGTFPGVYTVTGALTLSAALTASGVIRVQGAFASPVANTLLLANSGAGQSQLWALGPDASTAGNMALVVARSDGTSSNTAIAIASTGIVTIASGAVITTGGLTVSAGTTAVQALTATNLKSGSGSGATISGGYLDVTTDIGMTSTNGIVSGATRIVAFGSVAGTLAQATFYGWSAVGGASHFNGQIALGDKNGGNQQAVFQYDTAGQTTLYIDNAYDSGTAAVWIRTRTAGTPINVAKFDHTNGLTLAAGISATTGTFSTSAKTASGATSCATTVLTTIFALAGAGLYWVLTYDAAGGATNGSALIIYDGTNAAVVGLQNYLGTTNIAMSGTNVQVAQGTGSTKTMNWSYLRIN